MAIFIQKYPSMTGEGRRSNFLFANILFANEKNLIDEKSGCVGKIF